MAIWWWHDNDNKTCNHGDVSLTCNNVISIVNHGTKTYTVIIAIAGKPIHNAIVAPNGESTICRPSENFSLVVVDDNNPIINLNSDRLTSNYLFLSDSHFYYTETSSKGKPGQIKIGNKTRKKATVVIGNKTSIWRGEVEANDYLECVSEYLHNLADERQEFTLTVTLEGSSKPMYHGDINGKDPLLINIDKRKVELN